VNLFRYIALFKLKGGKILASQDRIELEKLLVFAKNSDFSYPFIIAMP